MFVLFSNCKQSNRIEFFFLLKKNNNFLRFIPIIAEMELTVMTVKQEPTDDQTKRRRAAAEMAVTAMAVSVINNSRRSRNNSSPMKAITGAGPSSSTSFSVSSTSSPAKSSMTVEEWCRLANISTQQNTKSRAVNGFRDDDGEQSPMYRYGIAQMIKLYIPPGVSLHSIILI